MDVSKDSADERVLDVIFNPELPAEDPPQVCLRGPFVLMGRSASHRCGGCGPGGPSCGPYPAARLPG